MSCYMSDHKTTFEHFKLSDFGSVSECCIFKEIIFSCKSDISLLCSSFLVLDLAEFLKKGKVRIVVTQFNCVSYSKI